jgi:hypothetical protein
MDKNSMKKGMMSQIIKYRDWLADNFTRVLLSISMGRYSLEAQPIPPFTSLYTRRRIKSRL